VAGLLGVWCRCVCVCVCARTRAAPGHAEAVAKGIEDLVSLTHLHEPAVLHAVSLRFAHNIIYTYTGPILLAVNPFKSLPLYSEVRSSYPPPPLRRCAPASLCPAPVTPRNSPVLCAVPGAK
jgi:hypothetical protein